MQSAATHIIDALETRALAILDVRLGGDGGDLMGEAADSVRSAGYSDAITHGAHQPHQLLDTADCWMRTYREGFDEGLQELHSRLGGEAFTELCISVRDHEWRAGHPDTFAPTDGIPF